MKAQSPTSLQTFETCPRQYEAKYITKEVVFKSSNHALFGDVIHKSIENYLKKGDPLPTIVRGLTPFLDKLKPLVRGVEERFAVDKEGKACAYSSPKAVYRCAADLVLVSKDERFVICVDWKTGKKRDASIQHDVLAMCAMAEYPEASVVTAFVYLFTGDSDIREHKGLLFQTAKKTMAALAAATANKSFPPKPGFLCGKWCDVTSCPFNGKNKDSTK